MTDVDSSCKTDTHTLTSLDADAVLDDLEPLLRDIGAKRIVAIGESAHFVREFTAARQRVLRLLAERAGFTVLAYEYGFSEAFALDRWLQGGDGELAEIAPAAVGWGAEGFLRWVRGQPFR